MAGRRLGKCSQRAGWAQISPCTCFPHSGAKTDPHSYHLLLPVLLGIALVRGLILAALWRNHAVGPTQWSPSPKRSSSSSWFQGTDGQSHTLCWGPLSEWSNPRSPARTSPTPVSPSLPQRASICCLLLSLGSPFCLSDYPSFSINTRNVRRTAVLWIMLGQGGLSRVCRPLRRDQQPLPVA